MKKDERKQGSAVMLCSTVYNIMRELRIDEKCNEQTCVVVAVLDRLAVKFNYHVEEQNILPRTVCRTVLKTGGVFFNGRTSVHATGNKIINMHDKIRDDPCGVVETTTT